MRSLSYLNHILKNKRGNWCSFFPNSSVECEQSFIIMCNSIIEKSSIKIYQPVNTIRKVLFSNKRFFWKRKRRIGL